MSNAPEYRHLFFDLDNTLTRSRSKITAPMFELLSSLTQDVVVISGASVEQIHFQLDSLPCYILGQNGNHATHREEELWHETLSHDEVAEIEEHIATLPRTWVVPDEKDLIENRGSQVSYSIYGHHAPVAEKERFDPDHAKRTALLATSPLLSDTIEVKIAGTTCLDYFRKGRNKGYNVLRLIEHEKWEKKDCLYFGDALYPGGNDETVIGVIKTSAVQNPDDTYAQLQKLQ